ncbi:MAG: hypothetical protein U0935_22040 [Pirellulales bacterium]
MDLEHSAAGQSVVALTLVTLAAAYLLWRLAQVVVSLVRGQQHSGCHSCRNCPAAARQSVPLVQLVPTPDSPGAAVRN